MSTNIVFKYGDYSLIPRPIPTITKEYRKTAGGSGIGTMYDITLDGYIVSSGGYSMNQVFSQIEDLRNAFDNDGKVLLLQCGTTPVISGRPRIVGMNVQDGIRDNYTYTAQYQINLEMETLVGEGEGINEHTPPQYISDFQESWSLDFQEGTPYDNGSGDVIPIRVSVNHDLSAVGVPIYVDGTDEVGALQKMAWEQARDYLYNKLGVDNYIFQLTGILNFNAENFAAMNNARTVAIDESSASVAINENFILVEEGDNIAGRATETFEVSIGKNINDSYTTVDINGTIEGYELIDYGTIAGDFLVTETKFSNASGYWNNMKSNIYYRANQIYQKFGETGNYGRPLNTGAVSQTLGTNQLNGTISYSYQYNDRPYNCIPNSLIENISITDTYPGDLIAQLTVLGRSTGPLLQSIGTKQPARQRDLNIDVLVAPGTGCNVTGMLSTRPKTEADSLALSFEIDLSGDYSQVFRTADSESWNIKTGRYTRNVSWIFSEC